MTKQKQGFEFAILKKNQWENQCEKWLHLLFNNLLGKLWQNPFFKQGYETYTHTLLAIDRRVGGAIVKNCKSIYLSMCVCVCVKLILMK